MSFYWFSEFGWETIDHALFLAVLGVIDLVKSNFFNETPKWHFLVWKRIVWALKHGNRFTRLTCGGEQENNMKGKERKGKPCIKSHKSVICHIVMGVELLARCKWNLDHLFLWSATWILPSLITVALMFEFGEGLNFTIFPCSTWRLIQQG
jgi:hypothetical protein